MTITSNIIWTSKEACKVTQGQSEVSWTASSVCIDSREIKGGELFVALKGNRLDGHDYVAKALEQGAAAAVVSRVPEGVSSDAPLMIVDDTFLALQALGRAARARCAARIIGITGSVGKTGTKEMLAAAFGAIGQTHASGKSYNNHWGVPFSLSNMHEGTDYAIFEMGMNHSGEITPLTQMVQPHIAIITNVAPVHIENFDSEEQIADAKAEIFDGVEPGGMAVLNRDNQWFERLESKAESIGVQVFSFGEDDKSDACLLECLEAANGTRVKAKIIDEEVQFNLSIAGRHIAQNALAVLLAVKLAGGDLQKALRGLSGIQALAGRGRQDRLDIGDVDNPVTLIDESYNASPIAMRAAFKVMALIDPGRGGRRIAVLGDMKELGADAARLHSELALPLEAAGVQLVYTCGPLMKNLYDALPAKKRGEHRDDHNDMAQIVPDVIVPGDVVLVKGSRGGGEKPRMQVVVEALRALPDKIKHKKK